MNFPLPPPLALPAFFSALFAAGALAACVAPPPEAQTASVLVHWPERQLLFSGDHGSGAVRVFHLIGERPVPVAVWRSDHRSRVLGIRIDRDCGGVWVFGEHGPELHAFQSGATVASTRVAAPSNRADAMASGPACAGALTAAAPSGG